MDTMAKLGRAAAREKRAAQPYTPMPMSAGPTNLGARFGTWLTNKMFGRGSTSAPAKRGKPPQGGYTSPRKQTGPNRYKGKNYRPYPAHPSEGLR